MGWGCNIYINFMTCDLPPVADSSGRYRGQFMFGNIFWVGSKEFCLDVNYYNLAAKRNATKSRTALPDMNYVSTTMKLDLHSLINKVSSVGGKYVLEVTHKSMISSSRRPR